MSEELTPLRRAQHMHQKLQDLDKGVHELLQEPDARQLNAETLKHLNHAAQLVHDAQAALQEATLLWTSN